jgi:hypothetical protein
VPGQGCTREGVCVGCLPGPECAGAQCGFDSLGCACGSCGAGLFCQRDRTCAVCPDTLGSVTIDTFCQTIEHGLKRWSAWNYQSCGMVIDDADPGKLHLADIDHLDAEYGTATDGAQIGLPPYYPVGPYDELMTCSADLASPFNALKTAVAAGHVCFDSRAVDDCMNAAATLKQAGSYGSMEPLGRTPLPASCSKFFYPHQKKGEPCANQWECVEGLYCKASDSGLAACTGVCAPPLTVGRPCTERDVCQKKSACKQASTGAPYECVALIPSGQACNPNADDPGCEEDLYCSPSKKKCTAYGALGDPCEAIDSYGTPSCTGDLQCVSPATGGAKVCTTPPKPLGVGRVCAADSECRDCLWCKGADSSTGTTGLCRPLAKIGDACNPADANPCPAVAPLVLECAAAKQQCRLMPREGATCFVDPNGTDSQGNPIDMDATQWGDCLYLDDFCKRTTNGPSGVCSAPPKLGEPCGNTFSSASWCQGTAWCKATGATSVCSAPEPDGTSCDVAAASPSAACASGYCLVLADGTGRCGVPPGVGSPCGRVAGDSSPSLCGAGAYCAVTQAATDAGPAVYQCLAIKAGADACTSSSQCATGLCGYDGKCALDCMSPPGTDTSGCGAYNGFNWFAKYIFAAGTLLFLGRRRRKKSP